MGRLAPATGAKGLLGEGEAIGIDGIAGGQQGLEVGFFFYFLKLL